MQIILPSINMWTLQQVRHVPELKKNLIFVGQLDIRGHSVVFSRGAWKVTNGVLVLERGKRINTLHLTSRSSDM